MRAVFALAVGFCAIAWVGHAQVGGPPPAPQQIGVPSPVLLGGGKVEFNLAAPGARAVDLAGDFGLVGDPKTGRSVTPMHKGDGGVWTVTLEARPELYHYSFSVDGVHGLDPQNSHVSRNPLARNVANWFIVPGEGSANYQINDVPHGQVTEIWYPSPSLHAERRMVVYTPPGYFDSGKHYPVLYLLHGGTEDELTWSDFGRAPEILDNLIAQGRALPMIVVMPNYNDAQALSWSDANGIQSMAHNDFSRLDGKFPDSVASDLIPFVDAHFRTIADRDDRAIAGTSGGGAMALLITLHHLDDFSWTGVFSGGLPLFSQAAINIKLPPDAVLRRGPDLGRSIDPVKFSRMFPMLNAGLNSRLHLFYWSAGGSEGLLECLHDARKLLDQKGITYVWSQRPGYGHEWPLWRLNLQDFAAMLFRADEGWIKSKR